MRSVDMVQVVRNSFVLIDVDHDSVQIDRWSKHRVWPFFREEHESSLVQLHRVDREREEKDHRSLIDQMFLDGRDRRALRLSFFDECSIL